MVNTYKLLGLIFFYWTQFYCSNGRHCNQSNNKKGTTEILQTLKKIGCNSPVILLSCDFFKLFDAQIAPTLLYAAEIWGFKMYEQIERVHLFACKRFLHVRNKTPDDVVYGELGSYPLFIPASVRCVKYWLKLLRQTDNLYSKKSYKMLLEMQNRGKTTWVSHIRSILCYNGSEQVWLFGCGNGKIFFNELKERLYSSFCHG